MSELLAELDQALHDRDARLLEEQNNALVFLKIERVASIIQDGGIALSVENIADFSFLSVKEVTEALNWMQRGAKKNPLPFELDSQQAPKSVLAQVLAGLVWIESRGKSKRGKKPLPPQDTAVVGVQRVMQLTGLGRMDVLDTVSQHKDEILQTIPEFRDGWVNDSKEVIAKNARNQHPDTKIKLIRQAVEDIAQGRIGSVTTKQLQAWKNGAIGLDSRQIDKYLSNSDKLRDLDKYRFIGKHYAPTDADKEAAYNRSLRR